MATSVEMSAAGTVMNLDSTQTDTQPPPRATKLLTESRPVSNSKTTATSEDKSSSQQSEEAGNGKSQKIEVPKPKIFDNKNFVEAPLPKTNPWGKPAAPVVTEAGKESSMSELIICYSSNRCNTSHIITCTF